MLLSIIIDEGRADFDWDLFPQAADFMRPFQKVQFLTPAVFFDAVILPKKFSMAGYFPIGNKAIFVNVDFDIAVLGLFSAGRPSGRGKAVPLVNKF